MKKINMYNTVGDLEKTFDSIAAAAKFNGVCVGTINKALAGIVFNSKGHIFAYEEDDILEKIRTADKSVMVYDRQGHFIGKFVSITVAAAELEVTYDKLYMAQKTGRPVKQEGFFVIGFYEDKDIRELVEKATPTIHKGTLRGEVVEVYTTMQKAADSVNGNRQGINTSTKVPGKTYKGFLWANSAEQLKKNSEALRKRALKANKDSKLYKTFFGEQ